jgi:uncharacterized membrane protein SpoIIM required for sporulation
MQIVRAIYRARIPILTVALLYLASILVGIIMVNAGNMFAINYRDKLVSNARTGAVLTALDRGERLRAALLDFGGNLYGASVDALGGLGIVFPFPLIAYRGWVGGIVSINSSHVSRLADPEMAAYYLITLVLQLIPYSLSGGAGVNMGLAYFRPKPYYQGGKWFGIPKEAVWDVLRIFMIVIPLFLIASLWEFFA